MNSNLEILIRSEVCIDPTHCYPVNTYLPAWITLILATSAIFILKDLYQIIRK